MSERKCYGFYISTNEALHRREEIVHDVKKLKGFLGICPQFFGQIFIIDTKENRDKGYEIFKEIYQSVKKCKREILVDEKISHRAAVEFCRCGPSISRAFG